MKAAATFKVEDDLGCLVGEGLAEKELVSVWIRGGLVMLFRREGEPLLIKDGFMEYRVELVMEGYWENSKLLGTDEFRELAVIRDSGAEECF